MGSHLLLELPQLTVILRAIGRTPAGVHQLTQTVEDISHSSVHLLIQTRMQTVDTPLRQHQKHRNRVC